MIPLKSTMGTLMPGKNPLHLFLILCVSVSNMNFVNSVMTSSSPTVPTLSSHSKPLNYQEPTFNFIPLTESDATQFYSIPDNVYNSNSNSKTNTNANSNSNSNTNINTNPVKSLNPVPAVPESPQQNSFNFVPQNYQNYQNPTTETHVYQSSNHQSLHPNQNQNHNYVDYKHAKNPQVHPQKFQKPTPGARPPHPKHTQHPHPQPAKKISYAQSLQHHFSNFPRIPWLSNRRHHIQSPPVWPTGPGPHGPQNGNGHVHNVHHYPQHPGGGRISSPKRKRFIPRREKYQQQQQNQHHHQPQEFLRRSQSRFPPQFAKDPRNFIFPDRRVSSGVGGNSNSGHQIFFSSPAPSPSPPPHHPSSSLFRFTYDDDNASSKRRFASLSPVEFMASSSNDDYQQMKMPNMNTNMNPAPAVPFLRLGSLENGSENPRPVLCAFLTESRGINGEGCIEV